MENKKYILVTGASSGIGCEIAVKLSAEHNIILAGRNEETLLAVKQQCSRPAEHLVLVVDLNKIDAVTDALQELIEADMDVSGFVHCAGYLKMLPLKSISTAQLLETMNVNFNSAVLIIKALISKKINRGSLQNVVFISSTASIMGAKAFNVYSGSKGAVDALMRSLAVELAPAVRLNSVLPGAVATKMTEHMFNDEAVLARMAKDYPLGTGEVNDIFEMVNFLLSDKSKWITGQQFVVDGGRSINISA